MKKILFLFLTSILLVLSFSCQKDDNQDNTEVIIYTYGSFVSEWGLGPKIQEKFSEKTSYTIKFIQHGDAVSTLNAIENLSLDSSDYPDLMIGIDNNMSVKALSSGIFQPITLDTSLLKNIPQELFIDENKTLIPFDYGYISIVYDSDSISDVPTSLEDLTSERFKDSLILIDPRSSSPGLAFFLWTIDAYGDDYLSYWERLKPSILTMPEGWSSAYGLFTSGEAPLVLSYTTSPAYHIEYEETYHIKSTVFEGGNYLQVEYAAVTAEAKNKEGAKKFIEFMLSDDFQSEVALTNIMYPASSATVLPDAFSTIAKPSTSRNIATTLNQDASESNAWLEEKLTKWQDIMSVK